jgi:hypothetical protein
LIATQKRFLTALDQPLELASKMPLELFLEDYREQVERVAAEVKARKEEHRPNLKAKAYQH